MADTVDLTINNRQALNSLKEVERGIGSLTKTFSRFSAAVGTLVGIGTAKTFSDIADQATNLKNRLTVLTGSQAQANIAFKQLVDVANGSRSSLAQVGELYARITQSTRQMGLSQSEALEITDTINRALISTGVSAQEAAGPLLQLGQALSAGALRGEELNSILEGMPVVAKAIADSLNVPIGALKKLGEQGAISSKDVIQALKNVRSEVLQGFGQTSVTIGQSFTVLQNSIVEAFGSLDEAGGVSKKVADAILSISDNIQKFSRDADAVRSFVDTLKTVFEWLVTIGTFFAGGLIARGISAIAKGAVELTRVIGGMGRGVADVGGSISQLGNRTITLSGKISALAEKTAENASLVKTWGTTWQKIVHNIKSTVLPIADAIISKFSQIASSVGVYIGDAALGFRKFGLSIYVVSKQIKEFFANNTLLVGLLAGLSFNFREFFERIWTGVGQLSLFEQALHSVIKTIGFVAKSFAEFIKSIGEMAASIGLFVADIFGLGDAFRSAGAALQYLFAHPEAPRDYAAEIRRVDNALESTQKNATKTRDAFADAFKLQLDKQIRGFKQTNDELIKQATYQRDIIGLSEDALRIREAQQAALKEQSAQLAKIQEQYDALKQAADIGGANSTAASELAAFERVRGELVGRINSEYEKTRDVLVKIAEQTNDLLDKEKKRELAAQALTRELDRQDAALRKAADTLKSLEDKLDENLFNESLRGLSEFEAGLRRIDREAAVGARDAIAQIMEGFEEGDVIPTAVLEQISEIEAAYAKIAEVQKQAMNKTQMEQQSFVHGWRTAFDQYVETAKNASSRGAAAFGSVVKNMENALDRFVDTGKLNFGDLARSIIADLVKIEIKAAAVQLFKSINLGSIFGGFFADGGSPPPGKVSVVGERGPELFVPKTAGTIIPNSGLGAAMQPVHNTYITNNISAVDAKSVAQLFAENRRTLLGATEQARRELPNGARR